MTSELMASVGKLTQMAIENGKQRDVAIARTEAAEAALAERDKPCVWRLRIDGEIGPGCSGGRSIQIGSWKFCPYCGHPVEVAP